ncbi:27683_t:CDS:1, partial [Racocetra persica]
QTNDDNLDQPMNPTHMNLPWERLQTMMNTLARQQESQSN